MSSPTCDSFFTCDDSRKHISLEQVMKMMIVEDANGCPVFKTTQVASVSSKKTLLSEVVSSADPGASGAVAAGAFSVMIETSEDFEGTINGVDRLPSRTYNFSDKDGMNSISYNVTAGSITIDKLVIV